MSISKEADVTELGNLELYTSYYISCDKMFISIFKIPDIREGDIVFAVYSYMAETDEAINLVEGERLYILGKFTKNISLF